jgi:aminocarboxymuconate-semialdehyde decarboxylase
VPAAESAAELVEVPAHEPGVRIDVHAHVVVDLPDHAGRLGDKRWPTFVADGDIGHLTRDGQVVRSLPPTAWLAERRLEDLDAAGVDMQVLSPLPPLICDWADRVEGGAWTRRINHEIAAVVSAEPRRLLGFGTVPLQHPQEAVLVLQDAHAVGLRGVEIGTTAGPMELDDPALREFFHTAAELDMLIYVHPLILGSEAGWTPRISGQAITFGLGMTTDTAIAAAKLVFGGVVEACPQLKIALSHGGGTFAWALPRIARLWDATHDRPVAELVRNVYVDSVVYDPANLAYLVASLGPDKVLFGTDYPLPAQADLTGSILETLTPVDRLSVAGQNAMELLGVR